MHDAQLARLAEDWGIHLHGTEGLMPPEFARNFNLAMDAQPSMITQSNAGIPAYLTQWISPEVINVLVAPMEAANIIGERQIGNWLMDTALFPVVENVGEVSSYGDFNNNGTVNANVNWPQRQSYYYQTITIWGERELERMGLARLDWASRLNIASALVLNKFQNKTYFFGVAGLQNYGLLNDPGLSAPLQPGPKAFNAQAHGPWITSGVVTATANEVYADVQSLFLQLVAQSNGLLTTTDRMVLSMSPQSSVALTATNSFGVNVGDLLKKNFPNIRIQTAPEYATVAGNLVQLIAESVQGQDVAYAAFNEKMRSHPVILDLSAFKQKKSQGTWGAIILQPFAISQMLGV